MGRVQGILGSQWAVIGDKLRGARGRLPMGDWTHAENRYFGGKCVEGLNSGNDNQKCRTRIPCNSDGRQPVWLSVYWTGYACT